MALWARPTGTIKNAAAQGIPRKIRAEVFWFLRDTSGGWQHGEVIRATRGNKEPEGQIRQAIRAGE